MKTMCSPGYYQNGFGANQAHMIYVMYTEFLHCIPKPVRKVLLYMCNFFHICKVLLPSYYICICIIFIGIHMYR